MVFIDSFYTGKDIGKLLTQEIDSNVTQLSYIWYTFNKYLISLTSN